MKTGEAENERVERRLAAILAADVAGYSRLIGADEEGTLGALRVLGREAVEPGGAEPGGICVSARVQEDAAGKLDLAFKDIGEQQLKNIARAVRVYRIGAQASRPPTGIDAGETPAVPALPLPDKPSIAVLAFQNMSG